MKKTQLSRRILEYNDIIKAAPGNSDEPLVDVRTYDSSIVASYNKQDMQIYTGNVILVRDTLARKLATINAALKTELNSQLKIVYGYRHPNVQEEYFNKRKHELRREKPQLDDSQLEFLTHNFVAIPDVAGHPTGGAIDVTITDFNGKEWDMGTAIANYTYPNKIRTFDQTITAEQAARRKILHDRMVNEEFAPFYGEWWHFSYGDREWAAFYEKDKAIYGTVRITK